MSSIFFLPFLTENGILFLSRPCLSRVLSESLGALECLSTHLEVFPMSTFLNVLLVILIIVVAVLAVLYFLGRKLEKRQVEQQALLEAAAQTVSMLVIDKKKMKIQDSNLPKMVLEQTPKYMRWAKVPVVKAKVGPKVMTLLADEKVFQSLPVKTEAKVVVSGIYITQIKSVRGGAVAAPPKKKGFFQRFKKEK